MSGHDWHVILARISPREPLDLDQTVLATEAAPARGQALIPAATGAAPPARLWQRPDAGRVAIGVRVTRPIADPAATATRLAAAAIERGMLPVILSALPLCGLEQFGFRVERLTDPGQEAALVQFWDMALVIDAAEIELFG